MTIMMGQFNRVAETAAERLAELLGTRVVVLDERGTTIVGSSAWDAGLAADDADEIVDTAWLRVPIRLNGKAGEVLIQAPHDETLSPRLVRRWSN